MTADHATRARALAVSPAAELWARIDARWGRKTLEGVLAERGWRHEPGSFNRRKVYDETAALRGDFNVFECWIYLSLIEEV